jgi:hypothetical protein
VYQCTLLVKIKLLFQNRVPLSPQQPANTVINVNIEVFQDGPSTTLYQVPQATGRSGPPPSYEEANDPAIGKTCYLK